MLSEGKLRAARIVSVVAATFISLACGTNVSDRNWIFVLMLTLISMPIQHGHRISLPN